MEIQNKTKDHLLVEAEKSLGKFLDYAIDQDAESILMDLTRKSPGVFYRFFKEWKKVVDIPQDLKDGLAAELRFISNIDEDKSRLPQTGQFSRRYGGFKAVFYVSVNPLSDGEKIFIDIFKNKPKLFDLRHLGLQRPALKRIEDNLSHRAGIFAVLGGFNSGRTSTLYSLLNYLNRPDLNVYSIEEDIEYDIPYVNQSKLDLKAGFGYSTAMSSVLKQDPDVIMVGDIEDKETAENSFLAADSGYPVLAGIYSRDVTAALWLLKDLGLSLPLFLGAVNMFLNQRITKKICHHCIIKDKKIQSKMKELKKGFDWKYLLPRLREANVIPRHIKKAEDMDFYKGKGCDRCRHTGFAGSIGVYELLDSTSEVIALAKKGHISRIKDEIRNQGGFYMKEDALIKAFNGITTIDEVIKIIKDDPRLAERRSDRSGVSDV